WVVATIELQQTSGANGPTTISARPFTASRKEEKSMGRNVAGRYHPAERFDATHSEGGSAGDAAGIQNPTPCRTRARTATLGSQLAHLQTTSHCHVPRVCAEVAEGRSNAVQAIDRASRSIQD